MGIVSDYIYERLHEWDEEKTQDIVYDTLGCWGNQLRGFAKEQLFTHLGTFGKPLRQILDRNEYDVSGIHTFFGRVCGAVYDGCIISNATNGDETAQTYLAIRGAVVGTSLLFSLGGALIDQHRRNKVYNARTEE